MVYGGTVLPRSAEVVVVGGGIIGASVAYNLSRSGRKVCLLEKDGLASGASGANVGLVALCNKLPVLRARLIWESVKLYATLSEELGYDTEYRRSGGINAFLTEEERAKAEKLLQGHQAMGLPTEMIDGEEVRRREPSLLRPVLGALYSHLDGYVNPYRTTVGYALAAKRLGATVVCHCAVQGLEVGGGRVTAVNTNRGRVATGIVVNAAGSWSPSVGQMVGLDVPVRPCRGQVMVTERTRPLVGNVILGLEPGARQVASGGIIVGSLPEFVGWDRSVTYHMLTEFAHEATISIPGLANLNVVRMWSGFRPASPDDLPILGPAGPEGYFLATGHFRVGVAMGPITGRIVAEMVNSQPTSVPVEECSFARFAKVGAS